jgi:hypothetical protein
MKKDRLFFWTVSGILMTAAAVILSLMARLVPGFAQGYSTYVYAFLKETIGRFSGMFPFSLSEAGLYVLVIFCLYTLIRRLKSPLFLLSRGFFLASLLFLLFTLNCGINYYRSPFSYEAGFELTPSSAEELYELCEYLVGEVNKSAGEMTEESRLTVNEMGINGKEAMSGLGTLFPQLAGWYPYPKALINSRLLSIQQLCGVYSPFTIEANYNRDMPYYNIPHTICHELSHLKGYMREDEANFIGYLACVNSDSPDFRYSGYLTAWVYAGNALAKVDWKGYLALYKKLDERAVADLAENNAFWDSFDGTVAETSNQINDRYLKAHSQTDGVQSYGRMVDLLLAYYRGSST